MENGFREFKKGKISEFLEFLYEILNLKLFSIGDSVMTIGLLITLIISVVILFFLSEWIKKLLVNRVLKRYQIEKGTRQSVGTIVKYVIIIAGLFSILQTNGIDLSAFGILAGALGVGIGFGLQNITNNFISGLIILFEQPIKVGDRIEVGEITGDVIKISARSTTVVTNDNISVIIPNSKFIDDQVINWSHNEYKVRFNFPVGVSYKEDPEKVKEVLLEVAKKNPNVLDSPQPDVLFDEFDDSSLNFYLRVWTSEYVSKPKVLKSQLYFEIFKRFSDHGIEIPFPQRDIHIKSGAEKLNN
ncbi:mechanosensitive ion channel family protein [Cecembia lonarensis]|uniref:Potassium efflux system KefA n=1 Tax=Cecembia lonarensis (strain CCUG 58316 / KCTC 22772 / LW9) TaxID=1225176 RepID=K1LXB7_CECL9|nr:mechanosensitive ion channel domain-containing protein [Cecembia lonarensis]EKB48809.1 Potassium efflux system KefA precursor [Cecembia lonarensis LW9]